MSAPTVDVTIDQYQADDPEQAAAIAAALTDDGWLDVTASGSIVLFPTLRGNGAAPARVAAVRAIITAGGEL